MSRLGWRGIGLPDQRDAPFAYKRAIPVLASIPKVKLLICPKVADQADLGACVYFAICAHLAASAVEQNLDPVNLSQLYGYYRYRELQGHINADDGCFIREAVKLVNKEGICREESWPYVLKNWASRPAPKAYSEAPTYRIASYHALEDLDDMLQSIAAGYGFVGGVSVYESFDSEMSVRTGTINLPGPGEKLLGGHALFFCGYDLHRQAFKFQNSWGIGWGVLGFGWIPFEYLTNLRLAGDFWTIRS